MCSLSLRWAENSSDLSHTSDYRQKAFKVTHTLNMPRQETGIDHLSNMIGTAWLSSLKNFALSSSMPLYNTASRPNSEEFIEAQMSTEGPF